MTLDFRIDWGYQFLYSRRHYHPQYIWDGTLECENGKILESYKLDYPVIWFGPGHCAKETKLSSPSWISRTKRGVSGVRFVAEVNENTVFHLKTVSFETTFTARDIINKGSLDFMVGPKYLNCSVVVTKTDYLWFRPAPRKGETEIDINSLGLEVHPWSRMKLAWLAPGESAVWQADIAEWDSDYCEQLLHIVAMGVPAKYHLGGKELSPGTGITEEPIHSHITLELSCDGEKIMQFTRYYREHDDYMQLLEDDWKRFEVKPGHHTFALKNLNTDCGLGISRLLMRPCRYNHGQLVIPEWALKNETVIGKVFAVRKDTLTVSGAARDIVLECEKGWNEFEICVPTPGNAQYKCNNNTAKIEIYDIEEEADPVKVGYDMTVVPHDANGYMDMLLDYTHSTRLGNYVVFRAFNEISDRELLYKWGGFCKKHKIYVSSCFDEDFMDGKLIAGAGEMFHDCGRHEFPGAVYAFDPKEPHASADMKEASEKYTKYLKDRIDENHKVFHRIAFGDASGGIRYSYLAGVTFVRAETMVGHTTTLLSQARPACEALGDGRWGVHIAIQHNHQLYHENHLGMYFLSLMQPWIMGANTIYEEDSLFELFKEERQSWDDALTKGKRDMTRSFFKFAKTHPRSGKCVRNIAFLEGRYAAPFNGFICDVEQDPHYSVWGLFGNNHPTWGHAQPEKCRQLLDVLMPGASTHPFRQKFDKRRFFFSGSPYGDFDCIPAEASAGYMNNYKLIMNLGWNTAINEDMDKLTAFVQNGGVLLTGIPQFSTHVKREFLENMDDLSLINGGDLSELCGIKVLGKGEEYCGQFNCKNRENMPEPQLSAMPSDSAEEDGKALMAEIELCGAEIMAWDTFTGKPMLVRNRVGKGYVYTFTLWAYPGHEKFRGFTSSWIAKLCSEALPGIYVEDASGEVFWTQWQDGENTKLFLLNTDWSTRGNKKTVNIVNGRQKTTLAVTERTLVCVTMGKKTSIETYSL
ncbi:MAG: hypothetical protein E7588_07935 [Ruminococcaceae bacterium]|nr:hypothetical protein [Oscillospiraceae bacterium]